LLPFSPEYFVLLSAIKIRIYETIILPVDLCGCEIRALTLREEHRLRVCENRVLWRLFGPRMDELTGGCRKLHEELHNLYFLQHIIRMRWTEHVA
jgi:hypothetical protein